MERVLVPIAEKLSRILLVMPLPRPTMTMTAMTPMMMPSMVRKVRSLLLQTFCSAWRKSLIPLFCFLLCRFAGQSGLHDGLSAWALPSYTT